MAFKTATITVELRDGKDGDGEGAGADVALRLSENGAADPVNDEVVAILQIVHQPEARYQGHRAPWKIVPELVPGQYIGSDNFEQNATFNDALNKAVEQLLDTEVHAAWLAMHEDKSGDPGGMY